MQAAGSACGVVRALRSAQLWGERARYERWSLALSDVLASRSTVLECTTNAPRGRWRDSAARDAAVVIVCRRAAHNCIAALTNHVDEDAGAREVDLESD